MISVLRVLKRWLDRLFFDLVRHFFPEVRESSRRTILVIRTDGIGDLVYFLQTAGRIRKHFADSRLVLVCRDTAAPIAAGAFDEVIAFRYMGYRWNYLYRIILIRKIRRQRATLALYCSYHRQHIGDEMTLCAGAQRTIAFQGNDEIIHPAMRVRNDQCYSDLIQSDDHIPERVRHGKMIAALGVNERFEDAGSVSLPSASIEDAQNQIPEMQEGAYIVLAPGASAPIRRWPVREFVRLGDKLAARTSAPIVLCGGNGELDILHAIESGMKSAVRIVCDADLLVVVSLIRSAKLFVGNESGLLHIAAASGTPAIGILGGGHFARYFPYGSARIVNHKLDCYECNWKCPFPEPYCLTRIAVEDVMRKVEEVMDDGRKRK